MCTPVFTSLQFDIVSALRDQFTVSARPATDVPTCVPIDLHHGILTAPSPSTRAQFNFQIRVLSPFALILISYFVIEKWASAVMCSCVCMPPPPLDDVSI